MNLLTWTFDKKDRTFYAPSISQKGWTIKENRLDGGYSLYQPDCGLDRGWCWYGYADLHTAKEACEYWEKEMLINKFTAQEWEIIKKFFQLNELINESN